MNGKIIKSAGAVLFLALINFALFSLTAIRLTAFWISWIFIHIAFVIFAGVNIFSAPEQRKLKFAYSETAVVTYYFIVELVAGFVLMTYFAFFPVASFILQTVILAVFLAVFFLLKRVDHNIDVREETAKAELRQFQALVEGMKSVLEQVDYSAPYRKTVQHACDAVSGSQVHSSPEAYEVENGMWELIGQLKEAVAANEAERVGTLCKELEARTAERNRRLRMGQ